MSDRPESLAAALVELQQHLPRIGKDSAAIVETKTGRTYGYKYADLSTISHILLPMMAELGMYWTCQPTMKDGQFVMEYELGHVVDESTITGLYPLPSSTPQTMGGAITYARRYCLLAVTGAAPDEDDDDAQAAEQAARVQRNAPPEVRADGSATEAEQMRMNRGHEPGTERFRGPAPDEGDWQDEPGQPLNPPSEEAWGSIGPQQKTRMFAMFGGLGMREKDKQIAFIEEVTGVRVGSRNDLSYVQAGHVLEALETRSGK